MELLIVVVNYNGLDLTIDCLESLVPELALLPRTHVGLCDNGSKAGEADRLARALKERGWEKSISLTRLEANLGFTGGNNAVIGPTLTGNDPPDFVLLLNNDTVVRPGSLRVLLDFMKSRPDVGIAGSRLENPDGTPQVSAFRFLNFVAEFDRGLRLGVVSRLLHRFLMWQPIPEQPTKTDWVPGASMIIRREVFDAISLLDEGYYTYFDDIDFCWNAWQHNWPTWYVPQSQIVHLVGKTTGVTASDAIYKRKPAYFFDARRRYLTKNLHPLHAAACDLAFAIGYCLNKIRCLVSGRKGNAASHELRDHVRHSVFVRGFQPPIVSNYATRASDGVSSTSHTTAKLPT